MKKLNTKMLQEELELVSKNVDLAKDNIEKNRLVEEFLINQFESEFASLWYYNEHNMTLFRSREKGKITEISLDLKSGIMYKAFMTKEARIYNYIASDKDYVASIDNPDAIRIKSKMILPLLDNDRLVGVVTLYSSIRKIKKFTKNDMEFLKLLEPYIINFLYKIHKPQKSLDQGYSTIEEMEDTVDDTADTDEAVDKRLQLMSNFVHDIRTPANTLYGFLELLEEQLDDKRLKEYVVNAKESASFINQLTTAMLDRVSLQKESEKAMVTEVESAKFFANIAEMFSSNMYAKEIGYNIYIDPLIPKVIEVDTLKLKRTLMNLLGNAYKFTPTGKNIEFSLRYNEDNERLYIEVKDEGIGIPEDRQEKIFEAFEQADDTTSINYGGTGLGLSICAEYVGELGGKLELKSVVDKGTTFYFDIPVVSRKREEVCCQVINSNHVKIAIVIDQINSFTVTNMVRYMIRMGIEIENITVLSSLEDVVSSSITNLIVFQNKIDNSIELIKNDSLKILFVEEQLFSLTNDEKENFNVISTYSYYAQGLYKFINVKKVPKVLIVDDDRTSIILLEKILESEYCEIDIARNGKIALEMIIDSHKREDAYSVVYIDNHMPLMNGLEVMSHVREFEKDNKLSPIFAVSTSGNTLDLEKEGKNFNSFVGKPFRADEIREVIKLQGV